MTRRFTRLLLSLVLSGFPLFAPPNASPADLEGGFNCPPMASRPWVFWFWINGNISKEGITADLEAFKRVGIGGVLWMEVSGPWWAPDGKIEPASPEWHDAFQWAIKECARLGLSLDATLDFGYGSGGPHITPEKSMQKLVWTEQTVEGGRPVEVVLGKPAVDKKISAWLRPGLSVSPAVQEAIEKTDSYRDVAVLALPLPASANARKYSIPDLSARSGLTPRLSAPKPVAPPPEAVAPLEKVLNLTSLVDASGRLKWDAPPGQWLVLRFGHASNYKMTRPSPARAVGLECDRLSKVGIETHFDGFLRKIIEQAGPLAGKSLAYAHIDSWEAGCQNWTASFPAEFKKRRGYDLEPWLPVLTGRVVGSPEHSERFLWDVRHTASELILQNYALRFRELLHEHGLQFSTEAYGNMVIDNLTYAGTSDHPISEFWARGTNEFPTGPKSAKGGYHMSTKAMASATHTYGKTFVGSEAWTSDRGWRDHPFTLKGMGDDMMCDGVNRMIFHLGAHQPYEKMVPGLTHRKWGQHIQRHNTWFEYSRVWMDYLARCQFLLQQGRFVADVCYWFGEGAPLNVDNMRLDLPEGYDYDLCSSELVLRMQVRDGRIVLPSGMTYAFLILPDSDRMTLPLAQKIKDLVGQGARVVARRPFVGSPGLTGYPQDDLAVKNLGAELKSRLIIAQDLAEVFHKDKLQPDFEGPGLRFIHRQADGVDYYFVANTENTARRDECSFRVSGKQPELWDPETGLVKKLPQFEDKDGRTRIELRFGPMQAWFVVFRENSTIPAVPAVAKNFYSPRDLREISGQWQVRFDPKWGGPAQLVDFGTLTDWSQNPDPRIHYYSGTAIYQKNLELTADEASSEKARVLLDLGSVAVMARVKLNGKDCGIAWKPPYLLDITEAARPGKNDLEISVANLWINRMIGDEQLPEDSNWKDFETLLEWPDWFKQGKPRPSGRYTFTTAKHYTKSTPLVTSGLLGPVTLKSLKTGDKIKPR